MAAKRPFFNFCSQKGFRSLADIAEHIAKLKEDLMETVSLNAPTSIFSLVAIGIKRLMIWGSKCHQNNLPVVWGGYVKYR